MSKSILQKDKMCFLTRSTNNLDKHHVMNGNGLRNKAEEDGLWIWLEHSRHMWLHQTKAGNETARQLKSLAQREYEKTHSHEEWMERYHKNYV